MDLMLSHKSIIKLKNLRRKIHENPEIAFQEFKTKAEILSYIKNLPNYSKYAKITLTESSGFWIDLSKNNNTNSIKTRIIAFRSELDALPLKETSGVKYLSKIEGISHACGHDGHIAILVGTLENMLISIDKYPEDFCVRFIFQPAEETAEGAKFMISQGCLENVTEIFGYHNLRAILPLGYFTTSDGVITSGCTFFEIIVEKEKEGANELDTQDILVASKLVLAINNLPDQLNFKDLIISIGCLNSETNCTRFNGTIRYLSQETIIKVKEKLEGIIKMEEKPQQIIIKFGNEFSPQINGKQTSDYVINIMKEFYKFWEFPGPTNGSDDFSEYGKLVKSNFFAFGCVEDNEELGHHCSEYDFNDNAIEIAIEFLTRIINGKSKETR